MAIITIFKSFTFWGYFVIIARVMPMGGGGGGVGGDGKNIVDKIDSCAYSVCFVSEIRLV